MYQPPISHSVLHKSTSRDYEWLICITGPPNVSLPQTTRLACLCPGNLQLQMNKYLAASQHEMDWGDFQPGYMAYVHPSRRMGTCLYMFMHWTFILAQNPLHLSSCYCRLSLSWGRHGAPCCCFVPSIPRGCPTLHATGFRAHLWQKCLLTTLQWFWSIWP